jgi:tRNA U34 5-methylaminomethyl-2-thiouridine-forming methyltransferase MnmC
MEKTIMITGDGSHTIYIPSLQESYHSMYGALTESQHVFIKNGLYAVDTNVETVQLLEIGFGTGLNALLTWLEAKEKDRFIDYTAVEAFPLEREIVAQLNYTGFLKDEHASQVFLALHEVPWDSAIMIDRNFRLYKIHRKILDASFPAGMFHCIYFDAFGPEVQPGMWTGDIFEKMYACLKPGGALVTYCAKGSVRRTLKAAGFRVEKRTGAPGKREMTRAVKIESGLQDVVG